jgi:hypothetical protein
LEDGNKSGGGLLGTSGPGLLGTSGRLLAATGGPGSGRADSGGGPPSGDKGEPGDINIEERPESVLDTLDRRRDPPLAGRGGGWSNESRVIPRGLPPPPPRSLTPPGCASAAAAPPLLLPSLAPLGVEVPPNAPPVGVLLGDGLQPPAAAADRGNESAAAEEEDEEEARR